MENSTIKMVRTTDLATVDYGEINLSRPAGGKVLTLFVKSPYIQQFFETAAKGKKEKVQFIDQTFAGFALDQIYDRSGRYSVRGGGDPFGGDNPGGGTLLTFLRHPDLAEGIELPINVPIDAEHYSRCLGDALGMFIEDYLAPFKAGYRFYFEKL